MHIARCSRRRPILSWFAVLALIAGAVPAIATPPQDAALRPMTFMDVQEFARPGSWTPSPDGEWMLYTISTPDWQEAESQSDIFLVSMTEGLASTRQMTFTEGFNETSPQWGRDGSFFVFLSDREASGGRGDRGGREEREERRGRGGRDERDAERSRIQMYLMRPDGGEARRISDADNGVADFSFSRDGAWLVFRSGDAGHEQLYGLPIAEVFSAAPEQLTDGPAGVEDWQWAPDSAGIYFTRPDSFDESNEARLEEGFSVEVKNMVTPLSNLWLLQLDRGGEAQQLTSDPQVSVTAFDVSNDGRWITFTGGSAKRYERNITGARLYADQYLLEVASGHIERLTDNYEVGESGLGVSPDGRWVAFSAPDDMTRYTMTDNRVYIREVTDRGGAFTKLGEAFDASLSIGFWSDDGNQIYFNTGVKVTTQLHALDVVTNEPRQITHERAALRVSRDEDSGAILIGYADPTTPPTVFTVPDIEAITDRVAWVQLVDANPQTREMALGEEVEINWTSTDGNTVGGLLVKPVGYVEGRRYPLIVAIHGGPASADVLGFNGRSAQVYAGAGYAVLKPNYRGSRNYGNAHRTDIVGDYFTLGFDDIMTGVDYLIDAGIVDPDRMGALGWSAGGHWSNWILTHTDRFKAISSGAGTMNWISMYAQSDVQRNRRFYIGDAFLYDNFEPYWNQSPLKYVANATTPTMIHVVEGDPRVPSPQSVELHMALKKLGVPTELFMYPGRSHGIPDPRNRLVKAVSEMAWMDHYVRGIGDKFEWRQVLETLEDERRHRTTEAGQGGR